MGARHGGNVTSASHAQGGLKYLERGRAIRQLHDRRSLRGGVRIVGDDGVLRARITIHERGFNALDEELCRRRTLIGQGLRRERLFQALSELALDHLPTCPWTLMGAGRVG